MSRLTNNYPKSVILDVFCFRCNCLHATMKRMYSWAPSFVYEFTTCMMEPNQQQGKKQKEGMGPMDRGKDTPSSSSLLHRPAWRCLDALPTRLNIQAHTRTQLRFRVTCGVSWKTQKQTKNAHTHPLITKHNTLKEKDKVWRPIVPFYNRQHDE